MTHAAAHENPVETTRDADDILERAASIYHEITAHRQLEARAERPRAAELGRLLIEFRDRISRRGEVPESAWRPRYAEALRRYKINARTARWAVQLAQGRMPNHKPNTGGKACRPDPEPVGYLDAIGGDAGASGDQLFIDFEGAMRSVQRRAESLIECLGELEPEVADAAAALARDFHEGLDALGV